MRMLKESTIVSVVLCLVLIVAGAGALENEHIGVPQQDAELLQHSIHSNHADLGKVVEAKQCIAECKDEKLMVAEMEHKLAEKDQAQSQLVQDYGRKLQEAEGQITQLESELGTWKQEVERNQKALADVEKMASGLQDKLEEAEKMKAELAGKLIKAEAQGKAAEEACRVKLDAVKSEGGSLSSFLDVEYVKHHTMEALLSLSETLKVILAEAKEGRTETLASTAMRTYLSIEAGCLKALSMSQSLWSSLQTWCAAELERVSPGAQAKLASLWNETSTALAASLGPVTKVTVECLGTLTEKYVQVEKELKEAMYSFFRSHPALAPYADPVYIQVLTIIIYLAPITLLAYPLAVLCRRTRAVHVGDKAPLKKKKQTKGKGKAESTK